MKENPPRRTALVGLVITVIGFVMIFAPGFLGIEGMNGGYAISFVSLFVAIIGIVVVVVFAILGNMLDKILRGEGLLAHWTYTPEKWKEYTDKEHIEEKIEKRGLFFVVSAFALFFGILFWILDPEAGIYVFLAMLGLIALIGSVALLTTWYDHYQNKKHLGEAYIAKDALYLNHRLHSWRLLGAKLESVTLEVKEGLVLLTFRYSAPTMAGFQNYTARVPVPDGQEETAKNIALQLDPGNS